MVDDVFWNVRSWLQPVVIIMSGPEISESLGSRGRRAGEGTPEGGGLGSESLRR